MDCRNKAKRGRPSPGRKEWDDYPEPVRDAATGCLRWQGPHHSNGYGLLGKRYAHREAWIREYGPIPDGRTIDHVRKRGCVHRDCVEPAHLEPVTQAVNVQRGEPASRTCCPQKHEYTPENTIIRRGKRECRTCVRDRNRAAYRRRKAARAAAA